jgi:hypothetical protein
MMARKHPLKMRWALKFLGRYMGQWDSNAINGYGHYMGKDGREPGFPRLEMAGNFDSNDTPLKIHV